jgi:hypothetical protein
LIYSGLKAIGVVAVFEVIEITEDEVDCMCFYDVKKSLRSILKKWSNVSEMVSLVD